MVRGAAAVCCARVALAFNALNALGGGVAYELQYTSFARSEGKEKVISLKCAIVRPRCFTLWVKCQCIVGEGVTSLLSGVAFVDVVGKEVLLILVKLHVPMIGLASLSSPSSLAQDANDKPAINTTSIAASCQARFFKPVLFMNLFPFFIR